MSIALASTFFSGVNVGADTIAKQVLIRQLSQVPVDLRVSLYSPLSADNLTSIVDEVTNSGIEEITHVEVVSRLSWSAVLPDSNETYSRQAYFRVTGVTENSRIYDGLTLRNGSSSLGANETYVWSGSENFEDLEIGDILHFNISMWLGPRAKTLTLNLTVVGFVDLDDQAFEIFVEHYYSMNVLIVDWSKTFSGIIDAYFDIGQGSESQILIFLDRDRLINPWDIDGSLEGIRTIASQIRNIISLFTPGLVYVDNRLEYVLNSYNLISQNMRLTFVITSIPVFFIAWYMGTTVSDVSYNLRRREIGLLLTKGFSRRQLLRMFLSEAILIGLTGGIIGIGLSFVLTPLFIRGGGESFVVGPVMGTETIIISIIFSVGLTLLAVFRPARRASKLEVVDALQEYQYVEEVKPYKKKWPWIAFILGSYKMIMWLLGINLLTLTMRPPPFHNILLMILLSIWIFIDTVVLNYVGAILFFWGFTKIFIRGSLKFQEFVAKLVKFAGDLIVLSTKNVRRNPARTAAIAFLIAMIIGYSFQVIGSYASEQDYNIRNIRFAVGADISVQLSTLQNLSSTEDKLSELSEVSSVTVEYRFWHSVGERTMTFVAVNPEEWLNVAHFESGLFAGRDASSAFQEMENDNNTIILERKAAERLELNMGEKIAIEFGSKVFRLEVVGLFGPKQTQTPISPYLPLPSYWSYVPEGFYDAVKDEAYSSGKILVKLVPGADGKAVAEEIRNLKLGDVSEVYSVAEILEQLQENPFGDSGSPLVYLGIVGSTEIQRLGVAFAVLAASLGTALVTLISLKERSKEVSVMSVRGLSFKQIVGVLLTENLAVVGFAVFLGAIVGLIVVHGNISAANSMPMSIPVPMPGPTPMYSFSPILRRMVFPPDSILTLAVCCVLVLASTIIPVIFTAKRYISELERIVREA